MKLKNIRKIYHNKNNTVEALKGINLEFNENGIIMILGSSGCGKTTLLNIMSGQDKKYEGSIEDVPNFDYLTQEFNLFEEMSTLENLMLVNQDKLMIQSYLEMFHMSEHQNKKVKLLSNGQKKRVQFIRALLHKPGLLLCDEPTAALDHENTEKLMEELVKLSKDIQIILVTHDIALSEKYADRIIKMDQGIIVSDESKNSHKPYEMGEKIKKKSNKETLSCVLFEMKSRWKDSIVTILLSSLTIVMLFSLYTFYKDVTYQYDYNETFKRGQNLIISVPNKSQSYNNSSIVTWWDTSWHDFSTYFHINQLYYADDVEEVIEENQEIIAVEAYWSKQYIVSAESHDLSLDVFGGFDYRIENGIIQEPDEPFFPAMYVYSDEFLTGTNETVKENLLYTVESENSDKDAHTYFENMLACYDLVNGGSLPLLAGSMSQGNNEVILSKNLADKVMKEEGYSSYEEMINQTILIGLYGRINNFYGSERVLDENEIIDLIEVTISGISSVESDYQLMIFFNDGFTNNLPTRYYVENDENLFYHYIRFLVEPGSDVETIANKINEKFNYAEQSIVKYEGRGLDKVKTYYKSPENFLIYFITIVSIFVGLFIVLYLFKKKRMDKENIILVRYGYSINKERLIRMMIMIVLSLVLSLVFAKEFCDFINGYAKQYQYEMLISYQPIRIGFVSCILFLYLYVLEWIILKKGVK